MISSQEMRDDDDDDDDDDDLWRLPRCPQNACSMGRLLIIREVFSKILPIYNRLSFQMWITIQYATRPRSRWLTSLVPSYRAFRLTFLFRLKENSID